MCETQKWNGGKRDRIGRDMEKGRKKKAPYLRKEPTGRDSRKINSIICP
jgi:hypothetical protein